MPASAEAQTIRPGTPRPLGATWLGKGTNFAVYSTNATRVDICIYDGNDSTPIQTYELPEHTYGIWHGFIPGIGPGTRYGIRAHGPYEPERGLRFNPNKMLVDPYGKAIEGDIIWDDTVYAYDLNEPDDDLAMDDRPSDGSVPKSVVIDPSFDWGDDERPDTSWNDTVIYEVHVKGFTQCHPEIPEKLRGTYLGMAHPVAIDYLKRLGVTAVELLPVHAFVDDHFLTQKGLTNYWGYSTLGFFAPAARYACGESRGEQVTEFKQMVKALHAAGIEVILDVVYNHSCEGNHLGPSLSFKGLDNTNYYRLIPEKPRYYLDFTGTGNSLDAHKAQVLTLLMDSLRYWATEMRVDGFRFDLASTLGRDIYDFDPNGGFFDAVHQDPVLSTVKLIAEPWDVGEGGYQVGGFPVLWSEWNDKFRDDVRTFWNTDQPMLASMGYRLTGSSDIYERSGRSPHASVNLIVAHDGFTLHDLVSYAEKHNEGNGEDNQDGHDYNISANYGVEGPTDDPAINELRERQKRNMLATLFFSQGTPMLCGGDEQGRTQRGNNNAYCQDNEISWFDWNLDAPRQQLVAFVANLACVRRDQPALRRRRFFKGMPQTPDSIKDVTWVRPDGQEFTGEDWNDPELRSIGMRLAGDAIQETDELGRPLAPASLMVIFHAGKESVSFTLPAVERGEDLNNWKALLTTDTPDGSINLSAQAGDTIDIPARTVMIFVAPGSEAIKPD